MDKHLQLHISRPCHEDWDSMSNAHRGRFCNSCQKQVIDFTNMTDIQLALFFEKPSTGNLCGRFATEQLDKSIAIPRKEVPWLKYAFTLSIPFLLSSYRSYAQGKPQIGYMTPAVNQVVMDDSTIVSGLVIQGNVLEKKSNPGMRGRVIDQSGKAVPFASVMLTKSKTGVAADSEGNFMLDVRKTGLMILEVSAVGYSTIQLSAKANENLGDIILSDAQELPTVIVKAVGQKMGGLRVSVTRAIIDSALIKEDFLEFSEVVIFPNPASAGGLIKLETSDEELGKAIIELYNLSGQQVSIFSIEKTAINRISLTLPTNLSAGTYFIKMSVGSNKKFRAGKLLVK